MFKEVYFLITMILNYRRKVRWKKWSISFIAGGLAVAVYLKFTIHNYTNAEPLSGIDKDPHGVTLKTGPKSLPVIDKDPHGVILTNGPKSLPVIDKDQLFVILKNGPKSLPAIDKDQHGVILKNRPKSLPVIDKDQQGVILKNGPKSLHVIDQHGTLFKETLKSFLKSLPRDPYPQNNLNTKGNLRNVTAVEETLCKHPTMELWPSNIKALMNKESFNLQCSKEETNWVYIANFSIYIDHGANTRHGNITCDCTSVERESEFKVNSGAIIKDIKNGTRLPSDFIYVNCTASDGTLYDNTHSGVLPHDTDTMPDLPERALGLNILMMGFDSMSRLAWQRSLPKTFAYLTESLGAVVLNGYNVAGDGTTQNILPLVTGMKMSELPEARRGHSGATQVDGYPWIWDNLKKLGYATQWSEDELLEHGLGGIFTYRMLGFDKQPVDHYMRNYFLYRQNNNRRDKPHCFGSVPEHLNMFNSARDMFESYKVRLKFSFSFHSKLSHDHINYVTVADEDLTDTLKYMNERGYFDNTLLIVMSDHGARFSAVRQLLQGKYEERNPFFSIRLPPKFIAKYPEIHNNLQINAERLTTAFDVHATFQDVISFKGVTKVASNASRGISLFQEIPADRTCEDVDLEPHWCLCLEWTNQDVTDPNVIASAKAFVKHVNKLTKGKRDLCEKLTLHAINRAEKNAPRNDLLKFKKSKTEDEFVALLGDEMNAAEVFYQIQVTTKPSMALYESTVKHSVSEDTYTVNEEEISRVNMYGDQPHCVATELPILRPYCYCKIQL